MAETIVDLVSLSNAERATMGVSGRRYVLEHYDRDDLSRVCLDVLECAVRLSGGNG